MMTYLILSFVLRIALDVDMIFASSVPQIGSSTKEFVFRLARLKNMQNSKLTTVHFTKQV